MGRRHLGVRRGARHPPQPERNAERAPGRLRHDRREPIRACGRKCLLPLPGRRAASRRSRVVQDVPLPVRNRPTVGVVAHLPEHARLLRRRLSHPVLRVERGRGRAHVALHPAAQRIPGALRRRRRAQQRAGGLAHRAPPRLFGFVEQRSLSGRTRRGAGWAGYRRQGGGDALRGRARALHPAGRDAFADARGAGGVSGRLAAGRGHLQELARGLDADAAAAGVGARAARLAAGAHQLAGR